MSTANELLRRALNSLNNLEDQLKDLGYGLLGGPQLREEIRTYLAAETEAEPVFIRPDHLALARKSPFLCRVEPKQRDDFVPLYTRPEPQAKPMTEEEIKAEAQSEKFNRCDAIVFAVGVRFAEKHHGIGGDDNG